MRKIFLISIFFFSSSFLFSAFNDPGWSARSEGMGGIGASKGLDSTVVFYNPAGILDLINKQVNFMLFKPYVGLSGVNWNYYEFSSVAPLKKISLGIGFGSFDADSLYKETNINFSVAKKIKKIKLGTNIKMLSHSYSLGDLSSSYSSSSKSAFTLGLGGIYEIKDNLNLGLNLDNLLPADVGIKQEDKVPMIIRFGISNYRENFWKFEDFLIALEFLNRNEFSYRIGFEGWFLGHTFGIRAGLNDASINTGLSYDFVAGTMEFQLDYAFSLPLEISNSTNHRIQLGVKFGGGEEKTFETSEEKIEIESEERISASEEDQDIEGEDVKEDKEEEQTDNNDRLKEEYFQKATELFMDGDYEEAIKYWKKVLEIDPNHELSKKKIKEAKKLLEQEEFFEEE